MADSQVALPYNATTSGDQLDAATVSVGGVTVKRERLILGNDASSAVAVVTSSGDLKVAATILGQPVIITGSVTANLSSNPALTSGIVTLSSAIAISSGLITLSSNPTIISASSGLIQIAGTVTVLNASSGLVQVLQSTGIWAVLNSSAGFIQAYLTGSSGGTVFVTTSGALSVTLGSAGAGSTAVSIAGAAGILAPVTSSYGLQTNSRTTGRLTASLQTTLGAPVTQILTTQNLWLYSFTALSTGSGTAGNAISVYSATSALSSNTPILRFTNPTAVFLNQALYPSGLNFPTGLSVACSLTFLSSATNTTGLINYTAEYEV